MIYGHGTISDACNSAVRECKELLTKYNVPDDAAEIITGIIREAYFQFWSANASSETLERILAENEISMKAIATRYVELLGRHHKKYPFDLEAEE